MSPRARAIMILGTASDVGKSLVTTALCRIFADRGVDVAPFKAQNMSLEAAVTPEGHEIGRAQALQAEAARRAAHVDMNPVLIKPSGDRRAQVIVEGAIWSDVDAWEYHRQRTAELFPRVVAAYERLAARCELIVLEGAGSPAEINLRAGDIVNMRMAAAAGAPCILVVDIDRGGAFAALVGTLALLEDDERARVRGFVVNKFRGDLELLTPGIAAIEDRIALPCFGVVPWLDDLGLEQEDGYVVRRARAPWPGDDDSPARRLRVAVVRYPQGANISDVDALAAEPSVAVRNVDDPAQLAAADVIVLPGSKATMADLAWLRARGLAATVVAHAGKGGFVFGLCGGLQMLGTAIADPFGVEGGGEAAGLGLLALTTALTATKTVRRVRGTATGAGFARELAGSTFRGYEIHVGVSSGDATPFAVIGPDGPAASCVDGAVSANGRVVGTYVHGVLDDDPHRHAVVAAWRRGCGLAPAPGFSDFGAARDARLDRWAHHVAAHLDVDAIAALT